MLRFWVLANALLVVLLGGACAPTTEITWEDEEEKSWVTNEDSSEPDYWPDPEVGGSSKKESKDKIDAFMTIADYGCDDPSQCHPSVAYLVGDTDKGYGQCTAFLVKDDIVATNAHCIPESIKSWNRDDCETKILLHFPKAAGYAREQVACAKVLSQSEDGSAKEVSRPDYAFIKLERPLSRPVFEFEEDTIEDGQSIRVLSVDPRGVILLRGRQVKGSCVVRTQTLNLPTFKDNNSAIIGFSGCPLENGNSGSPILNNAGKVIAIAHGMRTTSIAGESRQLDLGTHRMCVRLPEGVPGRRSSVSAHWESVCKNSNEEMVGAAQMEMLQDFLSGKSDRFFEQTKAQGDLWKGPKNPVIWRPTVLLVDGVGDEGDRNYDFTVAQLPACIEQRSPVNDEGTRDLPLWKYHLVYGKDYKLALKAFERESFEVTYSVSGQDGTMALESAEGLEEVLKSYFEPEVCTYEETMGRFHGLY